MHAGKFETTNCEKYTGSGAKFQNLYKIALKNTTSLYGHSTLNTPEI
jgi:hypothetical protein